MNKEFTDLMEELILNFKKTGDIKYMFKLENTIVNFLEYTVLDYLEETNDYHIDENTSVSSGSISWTTNS